MNKLNFINIPLIAAENFTYDKPYIMISILTVESAKLKEDINRLGLLRLNFDDINDETYKSITIIGRYKRPLVLFSKKYAQKILKFVEQWENKIKFVIIHCEAGISRSAAVAAALNKIYNGSNEYFFKKYLPNKWVYDKIMEAHDDNRIVDKERRD